MAFKMNGSPAKMGTISGTAGHSSALKMKAESALKAKNPKAKTYDEAYKENLTKGYTDGETVVSDRRKGDKKVKINPRNKSVYEGTKKERKASFRKEAEDWNMKTYGTKNPTSVANKGGMTKKELAAKHKASTKDSEKKIKNTTNNNNNTSNNTTPSVSSGPSSPNSTNIITKKLDKANSKITKISNKANKRTGEVVENVSKRVAKLTKKGAKKMFGKGSKQHLAAKQAHLVAKEADRQGQSGGRKQGLFRKISSNINKKRQEKNKTAIINSSNQDDFANRAEKNLKDSKK